MEVEIESEAGTSKGEDTNSQTNYLSGYRPGRFDTTPRYSIPDDTEIGTSKS